MTDNGDQTGESENALPPTWGQSSPPQGSPPNFEKNEPTQTFSPPGGGQPPSGSAPYPPPPYGAPQGPPYGPMPETDSGAITVLVSGILAIVLTLSCGIGFIAAIVALAVAPGASRSIRESHGTKTGEPLIRAGRICAYVSLGISALFLLAVAAWVVFRLALPLLFTAGTAF